MINSTLALGIGTTVPDLANTSATSVIIRCGADKNINR